MKNYIEETLLVITITVISFILYWYYFEPRFKTSELTFYALIFPIFLIIYLFIIIALKKNSK
ncbi:hypothetical protein SAMN02745115_02025 [[Eubacterium] yurii]|jgi:hypothetical protein|nr:hypothetical protein SAMN02745115_02025 [[Eubacterium] yurii]